MYPYPCSCSCRSTEFCCCYTPLSASIHVSLLCRPPAPPITVRVSRIVRSLSFSPFPGPSSLFTSATAGRLRQRQRQLTSDRPPPHHSGAPILPLLLFHYYYCTARSPSARTQPGSGERGAGLQQALISTGTHGTGTGTGTGVPPHSRTLRLFRLPLLAGWLWLTATGYSDRHATHTVSVLVSLSPPSSSWIGGLWGGGGG